MQRQWRRYNTPNGKKMFRYTMVSVISTVFGFTLLGIVFGVLHLWSEVPSARIRKPGGDCARVLPQSQLGMEKNRSLPLET